MKRILLVAALIAALGFGSASFAAPYAGAGFGVGASGFSLFGQFGDPNALGRDLGIRGRLGIGFGAGLSPGVALGAGLTLGGDVTYNFGRIFSPTLPLTLYAAGGPSFGYNFGTVHAPAFFVLGLGAGAGVRYEFTPRIAAFLEVQPLGLAFGLGVPAGWPSSWYNGGFTLGANFNF